MKLCIVMLEGHEDHEDKNSSIVNIHNEFYNAIMDEDLGCIEEVSKKLGRNVLIEVQDGMPRKVFWKVNPITQTFFNTTFENWDMLNLTLNCNLDRKTMYSSQKIFRIIVHTNGLLCSFFCCDHSR